MRSKRTPGPSRLGVPVLLCGVDLIPFCDEGWTVVLVCPRGFGHPSPNPAWRLPLPVRNYTSDRLPGLLDFVKAVRGWGSQGRELARQTFREMPAQPDLAPSKNCFLLEEEAEVQGFCLLFPELPISRSVLEFEVAPHCLRGWNTWGPSAWRTSRYRWTEAIPRP